ncbi:group III truncated hemoglobin [Tundrisphaera sp. TA3]|uniref:group III truncated hemoglobin n=1 Tax=Tundrisphaera sp. TA3 TaxID=3435775 RepID=UPI003EBB3664
MNRPPLSLPLTEGIAAPFADALGIDEAQIRRVVEAFYRRAAQDDRLGPVFASRIHNWGEHLAKMTDFWSAALLRTGRYSGNPLERHRAIEGLDAAHFDRWLALFESTARDLCPADQAEAYIARARRMRDALSRILP